MGSTFEKLRDILVFETKRYRHYEDKRNDRKKQATHWPYGKRKPKRRILAIYEEGHKSEYSWQDGQEDCNYFTRWLN